MDTEMREMVAAIGAAFANGRATARRGAEDRLGEALERYAQKMTRMRVDVVATGTDEATARAQVNEEVAWAALVAYRLPD